MSLISGLFVESLFFWSGFRLPSSKKSSWNISWGEGVFPPNWSWADWNGGVSNTFPTASDEHFFDVKVWLKGKDGRLALLDDINFYPNMNALEYDYYSILRLEAWTMPIDVRHLEVQQTKCSDWTVGRETKYDFVTFDT
jgi:hypothetical protein